MCVRFHELLRIFVNFGKVVRRLTLYNTIILIKIYNNVLNY